MSNFKQNLQQFNRLLILLQKDLDEWEEELRVKETQITKDKQEITRKQNELILKSNLVMEQVNGFRKIQEETTKKMLEAEQLKKKADEKMEMVENKLMEARIK